jgi:4-hydroxybenzoate polyprenyltransferase
MPLNAPLLSSLQEKFKANFPVLYGKIPALMGLIRLNKPIGVLLLLWPTISALWIAAEGLPDLGLLVIFLLGTFLMRSAGCCVNDIADTNFDGSVARTKTRPLAKGELERKDALYFFLVLVGCSFILVLLTNLSTIFLSLGAVVIAVIYPFMKRFTNLPQVMLGVAFSWGILMAFTAQTGAIPAGAYLLFIANSLWTIAYDTEYAMVDREDDIKLGLKSTAILFGTADRAMIALLHVMFLVSLVLAANRFELGGWFYLGLLAAVVLVLYQLFLIREREPGECFKAFLNNNWVGAAIFAGVFLNYL